MILTCPSCGTRYTVADGAIPPEGRQVRCASCKHRWHQDAAADEVTSDGAAATSANFGSPREFPEPEPSTHPAGEPGGKPAPSYGGTHAHPDAPPPQQDYREDPDAHPLPDPHETMPQASTLVDEDEEHVAARRFAATMPEQREAADRLPDPVEQEAGSSERWSNDGAMAEPVGVQGWAEGPAPSADFHEEASDPHHFDIDLDHDEEPRRRRGPLLLLAGLLLIAAIAALLWYVAPAEWRHRLGLTASAETPLLLQVEQYSRQQLASGNQLLEVTGRVINPTDSAQKVPPLQAQLRSLEQKIVYTWTIPPPARTLAPGGSASFNSAELNIPATAACLVVSFGALKDQQPCRANGSAQATRAS
jgi:predicted Zn finger-like uncharacterized protein